MTRNWFTKKPYNEQTTEEMKPQKLEKRESEDSLQ